MVPVRKPGRPLSSCPHPASRPCSCAALTAAILKKQSCRCGPASSSSSPSSTSDKIKKEPELNAGSPLPTSPTRSIPGASFRVQKQTSKGASRKQSVDINGLERMDANQLNIIQGLDSEKQLSPVNGTNGHIPTSGMNPYEAMGMSMAAPSFGPHSAMYHLLPQQLPPGFIPEIDGHVNGNGEKSNGAIETATGGCCGSKRASQNGSSEATTTQDDSKPAPAGSCCSSKTNMANKTAQGDANRQLNGNTLPMFQPHMPMTNGAIGPFFATPNIYTYPPQYGSYMQPLQPKQWQQAMTNMNMAPQVQQAYMFGAATSAAAAAQPPVQYQQNGVATNMGAWTLHECNCGDSCQCIGCAAHPYNSATQDYVRSAWNVMVQDAQNGHHSPPNGLHNSLTDGHFPHTNGNSTPATTTTTTTTVTTTAATTTEGGAISPPLPQTPSDATSGLAEEQALSASDFFFVSYPFGDGCDGEMASCQCGDDCQCIGCAIHNNPGPELVESV